MPNAFVFTPELRLDVNNLCRGIMIERYTLKNGIPLFIVETHASPVVSIQAWVCRGSAYETEKLAGISHFLEHALFKGTKRRKVGEIALELESRGGEVNAFTSFEETAYYTTLASRYFEEGLDVIADALQNPLFDEEEMLREREVILEEIKRAQDSPSKMVSTNLWKTSFGGTPYGRPVLGFVETVSKINHKTLREYFERNYHAGTTSLFVVGDVDSRKVAAIAEKKFAKMRKGKKGSLPSHLKFPNLTTPRIISMDRDVKECHLQLAVRSPEITHPLVPVADLMCSAVAQGEGSRLYQRLVKETHLALEVHMGMVATGRCGLATIAMVVPPENLEAALRECRKVLEETVASGLEEREIERVKSSLEAEIVEGKETVDGYARRLGYYFIQFGDPDYEKKYLDAVLAVNREQATEALSTILGQKPVLSLVHPSSQKLDKKALIQAITPKKLAARKPKQTHRLPPEKTTKGSLCVITKKVETLPVISLRLIFLGGTREEQASQYGITHLCQRMWTAGTPSYNALQISHTLDSLGASLYGFSGKNTFGISAEFLSKHWPIVKPLLTEILLEPTFPEKEMETEKNLTLREILSERDTPGQVCHLNFLGSIYHNHPYGRSSLGSQESVEGLKTEDLRQFVRQNAHQKRLVVSTVGNFEKDYWIEELAGIIGRLPATGKAAPGGTPILEPKDIQIVVEKKAPLFQSHILIGFLGASFQDRERYALKLLSSALAGQGGRLFLELRDKQSLAYTVSPMNNDGPDRGLFAFYIGCSPEKWEKSIRGIRTEIDKLLQAPMSAKELARAKEYWIGRFELEMQRYSAQAMLFGLDEAYGQGYRHALEVADIMKAVTAQEIQAAAQKYLRPDRATISMVHNQDVESEIVRYAWEAPATIVRPSGNRSGVAEKKKRAEI